MKKVLLAFALLVMTYKAEAQVGIGTEEPSPAALLDIVAEDRGILIPRVQLNSITDATTINGGNVESLLVYNSTAGNIPVGFYYWHNNRWNRLVSDAELSENTLTTLQHSGGQRLTYTDENGEETNIELEESLTSLVYDGDATLIYTDETGEEHPIDLSGLVASNPSSGAESSPAPAFEETVTSLIKNGNGTLTYTNELGQENIIDLYTDLEELSAQEETPTFIEDNGDGSFTYTNEQGEAEAVTVDYSQELGPFVLSGNTLELSLEKGGTAAVDLSELLGTAGGTPTLGEDLEAGDASVVVENGEGATLMAASVSVAEEGITTGKIASKAVSPEKLSAAAEDAGKVATVQEDGSVSYEEIKAAMPKFFYMPSILVPVRERQVDTRYDAQDRLGRINLYARYQDQFGSPMASSENAQASIPTLPATELEFHVTYYDDRVFQVERITADGILHYSVKDAPLTEVSFMNIVFVIK